MLAADLGATHSRLAVSDLAGGPLAELAFEMDIAEGPERILGLVHDRFRELLRESKRSPQGRPRHRRRHPRPGRLRHRASRSTRRSCRAGTASRSRTGSRERYGDAPVLVDNDVNIMALGEHWAHWREVEHLLYVKVGTGIGCGIVADRRIHRGAEGAAGDIGHIVVTDHEDVVCRCGNTGCLEAVAGGRALAQRLAAAGYDGRAQPRRRAARARGQRRRDPDGPRRRAARSARCWPPA